MILFLEKLVYFMNCNVNEPIYAEEFVSSVLLNSYVNAVTHCVLVL